MIMRKRMLFFVILATLLASISAGASTPVDELMPSSRFCDPQPQYRPGPALIDGPSSQLPVHNLVFEPAFAAACRLGSGQVTYLGTGEQAGINAIIDHVASRAFGTANVPMSPMENAQASQDLHAPDRRGRNIQVRHIPIFIGIEAVAYNLTSCHLSRLNLRSAVLSFMFSGQITKWNDPLLVRDNPELATCNFPIRIVKRADYSGSTLTFKDYLSKRNPQWTYYKQQAQNQAWPTLTNYCPGLDEDGMADCIQTTQNSIGYLSYHNAKVAKLKTAFLDNVVSQASTDPSQAFIGPSPQACTEAASSAVVPPAVRRMPIPVPGVATFGSPGWDMTGGDWNAVSLTDAPRGYPLCFLGFALMFAQIQQAYFGQEYRPNTARTAVDYLWTAVGDSAQGRLPQYDFARLPANIADISRAGLETIRYQT
jgi:ABC-type phosphate transport system substrate-binding protein